MYLCAAVYRKLAAAVYSLTSPTLVRKLSVLTCMVAAHLAWESGQTAWYMQWHRNIFTLPQYHVNVECSSEENGVLFLLYPGWWWNLSHNESTLHTVFISFLIRKNCLLHYRREMVELSHYLLMHYRTSRETWLYIASQTIKLFSQCSYTAL